MFLLSFIPIRSRLGITHGFDLFSDYIMAPQLAKPAPSFAGTAVINGQFKNIKLEDYKGKYLVLFFYPLDL